MNKIKIIVSACLLGKNCKYNGTNNYCQKLEKLRDSYEFIEICPEVMGGLSTPRVPSEIVDKRVINQEGIDVTNNYQKGALSSLHLARENNCQLAILKSKSPSCGCGEIYDGTFTHRLKQGDGITTMLFKKHDIKVITENDLDKIKVVR